MPIPAGQLDTRVRILRRRETLDTSGQAVLTWTPESEVYAKVEPLGGRTGFGSQQFVSVGDVQFTLRFIDGLNPLDQIEANGVAYDVQSVAPRGRRDLLVVVGKARQELRDQGRPA
jgi:SPP1 family predicted phage head-tail adaptor